MTSSFTIRPAQDGDVSAICQLLEHYAKQAILLPRNEADIRHYLANFSVAVDAEGKLAGCMAIRDFGNDLLEIRSLAVDPQRKNTGIGRALVENGIARQQEKRENFRIFALTLSPEFFEHLQFRTVDKQLFPEKIWSDCQYCSKQNCCDEAAVIREFSRI